jgi:putative ABC transport system permease protein
MAPAFSLIVLGLVSFTVAITTIGAAVAAKMLYAPSVPSGNDRVIKLYTSYDVDGASASAQYGVSSLLDFQDIAQAVGGRATVASYLATQLLVDAGGGATPVTLQFFTDSYFDVVGIAPFLGDVGAARGAGVVVSHRYWVESLDRSPDVLGTTIRVRDALLPVVAVLPPGFLGTEYSGPADLWLSIGAFATVDPVAEHPAKWRDERRASIIGRLLPGISVAEITPGLASLSEDLQRRFPATNFNRRFVAVPYPHLLGEAERAVLGMDRQLAQAIALITAILVLAYANVGNLFAVRSLLARREVAIRKALGATDARLVIEAIAPLILLVTGGAVLGLAGARVAYATILSSSPAFARTTSFIDPWTVGGLLFGGLLAMIVLGIVPVIWTREQAPASALTGGDHDLPRPHARLLWGLVAAQVMIACAAGGIAFEGFRRARELKDVRAGFDIDRIGDVRIALRVDGRMGADVYDEERAYLDRVRALPGVEAVATAELGLLRDQHLRAAIGIQGREFDREQVPSSRYDLVSPDYFAVLGLPMRWGGFSPAAIEAPTFEEVVVNEAFAAAYLQPGQEREAVLLFREQYPIRVVGVVANAVTDALDSSPEPRFYLPLLRRSARGQFFVMVRTTGPSAQLVARIGPAITGDRMVEHALRFESLDVRRERLIAPVRVIARTMLIIVVAIIALAAIGTYGILAVSLLSTRRSTAIRLALGGPPAHLAARALRPAATAFGAGGALAITFAAFASSSPTFDSLGVTGVLIALPLVAGVLFVAVTPLVRRVLRASPAEILRL